MGKPAQADKLVLMGNLDWKLLPLTQHQGEIKWNPDVEKYEFPASPTLSTFIWFLHCLEMTSVCVCVCVTAGVCEAITVRTVFHRGWTVEGLCGKNCLWKQQSPGNLRVCMGLSVSVAHGKEAFCTQQTGSIFSSFFYKHISDHWQWTTLTSADVC